jgi:hypothetical protein
MKSDTRRHLPIAERAAHEPVIAGDGLRKLQAAIILLSARRDIAMKHLRGARET